VYLKVLLNIYYNIMDVSQPRESLVQLFKEKMNQKRNERYKGSCLNESEHQLNTSSTKYTQQEQIQDFRKQGEYGAKKNIKP
jgi:hypothetical protein